MKQILSIVFIFFGLTCIGQVSVSEKYALDGQIEETSGLLFINNKIITHNDSGDAATLYELNQSTGIIERTISISNATNVDWEDIAKDESYIYIGDIGNNSGNRQDLKIYRIAIADFLANNSVTADIINFSYADQTDFTSAPNSTNFDAEALAVNDDNLVIFTKNWLNFETNVYEIPKTPGNYFASKVSSANVQGLITGATVSSENPSLLFLCGYNPSFIPFLVIVPANRAPGSDIFNSGFTKISLENDLEVGSQVEAIVSYELNKLYISREKFQANINGNQISNEAKLYEITEPYSSLLSNSEATSHPFTIQNPIKENLVIKSSLPVTKIEMYSILGNRLAMTRRTSNLAVNHLRKGIYILSVELENQRRFTRKIVVE